MHALTDSEHHFGQLAIEPFAGTVTVRFSDAVVAATERAKVLREDGHEPVFFIPFQDIYFDLFEKTNTTSQSPLKGTASYWRVHAVGASADDFMWAYETPNASLRAIKSMHAYLCGYAAAVCRAVAMGDSLDYPRPSPD